MRYYVPHTLNSGEEVDQGETEYKQRNFKMET